jgi:hypothetical protein
MSSSAAVRHKSRRDVELGLPPSWYLDAAIFEVERRQLFDNRSGFAGPSFVGRAQMAGCLCEPTVECG